MVELQIHLIACSFYTVNKIDVFTIDIYYFYKKLKKFMFNVKCFLESQFSRQLKFINGDSHHYCRQSRDCVYMHVYICTYMCMYLGIYVYMCVYT